MVHLRQQAFHLQRNFFTSVDLFRHFAYPRVVVGNCNCSRERIWRVIDKMGRPRALKNKDVVPAVKIDTKAKKHKKFDDSDDNESDNELTLDNQPTRTNQTVDEDDDNAPEEVVHDEIQIRALKEEVENLFSVQKDAKRKRKFTKEVKIQEEDSDAEYLNEKDLELVSNKKKSKRDDEFERSDSDAQSDYEEQVDSRESDFGLKRKIGKLEVAVIANASLNDFCMNNDAEKFLNQHRARVERTKYTSFMSQRRPAPAKKFSSKSSKK